MKKLFIILVSILIIISSITYLSFDKNSTEYPFNTLTRLPSTSIFNQDMVNIELNENVIIENLYNIKIKNIVIKDIIESKDKYFILGPTSLAGSGGELEIKKLYIENLFYCKISNYLKTKKIIEKNLNVEFNTKKSIAVNQNFTINPNNYISVTPYIIYKTFDLTMEKKHFFIFKSTYHCKIAVVSNIIFHSNL